MKRKFSALLLGFLLIVFCLSAQAAVSPHPPHSEPAVAMMRCLESDPELMALMEKSIAKAKKINPDHNTNPVQSIQELYEFLDWAALLIPRSTAISTKA